MANNHAETLAIAGVERTQTIQFFLFNGQGSGYAPNNSVPLIAQRATVLRVYVDHRQAAPPPGSPPPLPVRITGRATLERIRSDGSVKRLPDLLPINGPISPLPGAAIDRENPDHTLNFRIPPAECQGRLRLTTRVVEVPDVVTEAAPRMPTGDGGSDDAMLGAPGRGGVTSASSTVHLRFDPMPVVRIRAVLIHYTGGGLDIPAPTGLDFVDTFSYVLRTFPIGRIDFADCIEIEFDRSLEGVPPNVPGWIELLERLREIQDGGDPGDVVVGLLPASIPSTSTWGIASLGGRVAVSFVGLDERLAHEVAHGFGRKHSPFGNPPDPDPDFPKYDDYTLGSIGEYGFDTWTQEILGPVYGRDFMGYDRGYDWPNWVSPYTYMGLADGIRETVEGDLRASIAPGEVGPEVLHLTFRMLRDGTVQLRPSFHLPGPPPRVYGPPSAIACELRGEDGRVLAFHRCRPSDPDQDPEGPYLDVHEAIPWSADAKTITVLRDGEVVDTFEIEPVGPDVRIEPLTTALSDRPARVSWSAHHPERSVRSLLRFSHDGGRTWRVIGAPSEGTEHTVDPRTLPGGERCLLQVVATSGIRTTIAESEPFTLPVKPRRAHVLCPKSGAEFAEGRRVGLRGGGFSPDFGLGDLEDAVWSSSIDGSLGRGFEVIAENLSEGPHTITLTVPDGVGGAASTAIRLRVTARL